MSQRSHQLWLDFLERTDRSVPSPRSIPAPREKCAGIIEPRRHPHLSYVLRNVMHFLDDSWGLCVVHGTENRPFVENVIAGWGQVMLLDCGSADLPGYNYADYKCSLPFWQQLPAEHILIFET